MTSLTRKEREYIANELAIDLKELTDDQVDEQTDNWYDNELESFRLAIGNESLTQLEQRIKDTEALRYHSKCSGDFDEIKSLRLRVLCS